MLTEVLRANTSPQLSLSLSTWVGWTVRLGKFLGARSSTIFSIWSDFGHGHVNMDTQSAIDLAIDIRIHRIGSWFFWTQRCREKLGNATGEGCPDLELENEVLLAELEELKQVDPDGGASECGSDGAATGRQISRTTGWTATSCSTRGRGSLSIRLPSRARKLCYDMNAMNASFGAPAMTRDAIEQVKARRNDNSSLQIVCLQSGPCWFLHTTRITWDTLSVALPGWPCGENQDNINPKGEVSTSNATKRRWDFRARGMTDGGSRNISTFVRHLPQSKLMFIIIYYIIWCIFI